MQATKNLKEIAEALPPENREAVYGHLREAIFHILGCWDALREAESLLEAEIETDDIEGLAGDCADASDAFTLNEESLLLLLEGISA